MKFIDQGFQTLEPEKDTHRNTDATERITVPHSRGQNNSTRLVDGQEFLVSEMTLQDREESVHCTTRH